MLASAAAAERAATRGGEAEKCERKVPEERVAPPLRYSLRTMMCNARAQRLLEVHHRRKLDVLSAKC